MATDFSEVTALTRDDTDGPHLIVMPGGSAVDIIDLKATPNVAGSGGVTWSSDFSNTEFANAGAEETTATVGGSISGSGVITVTLNDDDSKTRSFPLYVNTAQEMFHFRNGIRTDENDALLVKTDARLGNTANGSDECSGNTLDGYPGATTGFKTTPSGLNLCNVVYPLTITDPETGEESDVFGMKPIAGSGNAGTNAGFITGIFGDVVLSQGNFYIFEDVVEFAAPGFTIFTGGKVSRDGGANVSDQSGVSANDRFVFVHAFRVTDDEVLFRTVYNGPGLPYGLYEFSWAKDVMSSEWENTSIRRLTDAESDQYKSVAVSGSTSSAKSATSRHASSKSEFAGPTCFGLSNTDVFFKGEDTLCNPLTKDELTVRSEYEHKQKGL